MPVRLPPPPAPKMITGTDVQMKDLMSDVASMTAFAEAITESAAAVASAVAEESAVAAAAVTLRGMAGGGDDSGKPRAA